MKIIATSDLHVDGKNGWGERSLIVAEEISQLEADVLFFCGDMASNYDDFMRGYGVLSKFRGIKASVLGNNCLETLKHAKLTEGHEEEMRWRLSQFGFHVLDYQPLVIDNIGFVGNSCWYDGSLFREPKNPAKEFPVNFEEAMSRAVKYFQEKEFWGKIPNGLTPEGFFRYTYDRVKKHFEDVVSNGVKKVVLGIHHVPHPDFVLYGKSPKYDYLNLFMGSEKLMELYHRQEVILKFTAHTHRDDNYHGIKNISSTERCPYHVFEVS